MTFAIIYAMVSFSSEVGDSAKVGTSQAQMANNMFQRLQTDVTMSNLSAQNTIGPATFQITNSGNTLLWNYDNFDVIINVPRKRYLGTATPWTTPHGNGNTDLLSHMHAPNG